MFFQYGFSRVGTDSSTHRIPFGAWPQWFAFEKQKQRKNKAQLRSYTEVLCNKLDKKQLKTL